jgi:hypothetical protein
MIPPLMNSSRSTRGTTRTTAWSYVSRAGTIGLLDECAGRLKARQQEA